MRKKLAGELVGALGDAGYYEPGNRLDNRVREWQERVEARKLVNAK